MSNKRILIVDDEETICQLLDRIVSQAHPEVEIETAKDGASALAQIKAQRFDLLLTDYSMPELDGIQLAAQVQKLSPDTRIILMTGIDPLHFRVEEISLPRLDGFLSKPFTIGQILSFVEQVMV